MFNYLITIMLQAQSGQNKTLNNQIVQATNMLYIVLCWASLGSSAVKNLPALHETQET